MLPLLLNKIYISLYFHYAVGLKKKVFKIKYVILLALVLLLYYGITRSALVQSYLQNPASLQEVILRFGLLAPLLIILLQIVQAIISIFPSQLTTIAAGFIFGPVLGLLYSLIGATIGSAVVFGLSKRYGKKLALKLFEKKDLVHFNLFFHRRKEWSIVTARMMPLFPNDIVSFAAGLTPIRTRLFLVMSTLGFIGQMILLVYFGAGLTTGQPKYVIYIARILIAFMLMAVLFRRAIKRILIKDIHKLEKEGKNIEKVMETEFKKI